MEDSSELKDNVDEVSVPQARTCTYKVRTKGSWYNLEVPLAVPYTGNSRELAIRLINAHKLPCYLEEELCEHLERFGREESLKYLDEQAEDNLYGGSVLEEGSETEQTIDKWVSHFADTNIEFAPPLDTREGAIERTDIQFSEVYHELIHSPALKTLLQLEHTYALAVLELCKARDNALEIMQKRHDANLSEGMEKLGVSSSEADINSMMRAHTLERERGEERWASELSQLQDSQRREYRDWVLKVHEDTNEKAKASLSSGQKRQPAGDGEGLLLNGDDTVFSSDPEPPPLEESFTIHLGTQRKTMHNIRVLCGDPFDLCRHKAGHTLPVASPERLLTAMSLYSSKLSGLVMMVDGRINSLGGIKEAFANVCHQSTDFHFHDIDIQLSQIQEHAVLGNSWRQEHRLSKSMSSCMSDSQMSRSASAHSVTSPDRSGSPSEPKSSSPNFMIPDSSLFHLSSCSDSGRDELRSSALLDTTSVSLEPGDFYMTRHSNLSNVHLVFHLVTEEVAVQSTSLKSRHPVVTGLKNCLRAAARHDVHHVTVPLLLVHSMQPDMTIPWCLRRAELIFKCVKGFMLENSSWGDGDSRTIQFLVPNGISKELFDEFCEMLPKIFRVTSSRNLTSRTSYK